MHPCSSRNSKTAKCQNYRSEKNSTARPDLTLARAAHVRVPDVLSHLQVRPLVVLQPLEVQGCLVPHLKAQPREN